jgi:hypothetical protein
MSELHRECIRLKVQRRLTLTNTFSSEVAPKTTSLCCFLAIAAEPNLHESVDVRHAILEQMQREHPDLVILAAIADHFTMAGEEDEIVGAIPLPSASADKEIAG